MAERRIKYPSGPIDMDHREYHARPEISRGQIAKALRSIQHMLQPTETTAAMKFGSAFHEALLEPEKFGTHYSVAENDGRTRKGKEERAEALATGITLLTQCEMETLSGMVEAVKKHPLAGPIVEHGIHEKAFFWVDPESGMPCRCMVDTYQDDGDGIVVVDWKSTVDALKFKRDAIYYPELQTQAGFYPDGVSAVLGRPVTHFLHIVVEKTEPFGVIGYYMEAEFIDYGRRLYKKGLEKIRAFREGEITPEETGYPLQWEPITKPHWLDLEEAS